MAIALPGEGRLPPGPLRDLVVALHELYDSAGRPGARVISSIIRQDHQFETVSHETVSAMLRGRSVPAWAKVQSIVGALAKESIHDLDVGAVTRHFHQLWITATPTAPPTALAGNALDEALDTTAPGGAAHKTVDPSTTARTWPRLGWPTARGGSASPPAPIAIRSPVAATRYPVLGGPVIGGLPDRNPSFVGRETLLTGVRRRLGENPNSPLVLYGVGGVGKSQLAREYVTRHEDTYSVIWWIPADRTERARASLLGLAERMRVPMQRSVDQTIMSLLCCLESQQRPYLVVFDGVLDNDIRPLMPTIGGHVVVTTRDPRWAHESSSAGLEVPVFDQSEAVELLRRHNDQLSTADAQRVAEVLGRLPLALDQIGALQAATGQPWSALLSLLDQPSPTALSDVGLSRIVASLHLARHQLEAANPAAMLTLELFAWLAAEPVSIALLRSGRAGHIAPVLSRTLQDPIQLYRVIGDMGRYGLLRLNAHSQRVEIQPLTRLALHTALTPDAQERARRHVHEILAAADPGWPDDLPSLDMHREIAGHVEPTRLAESANPAAQRAVFHQIRYRLLIGDFEDACRLGETAVRIWSAESGLGPDHVLVLQASREWANALRAVGRYGQARRLTARALERLRAQTSYGDDHPETLAMAACVVADLRIAGRYAEAQRMSEDTYQRSLARWGPVDTRSAASRRSLASALRLTGAFQAAHELDTVQLEQDRETLGPDHVRTQLSSFAVADDLCGLGRYREALSVGPTLTEATFPWARQDLLVAARTLALARKGTGSLGEATEDLSRQYHDCIEFFGADHEQTLAAAMSLANALREGGRYVEAYDYAADAVNTYRRTFGTHNPLTLVAEVNLAAIRRSRGEHVGAHQTDAAAADGLRQRLGERHPYTIAALTNLAIDVALAGDHASAYALSERAYALSAETKGATHPDTLAAAANMAADQRDLGAIAESEGLRADVLARFGSGLGTDHPRARDVAAGVRIVVAIEPPSP